MNELVEYFNKKKKYDFNRIVDNLEYTYDEFIHLFGIEEEELIHAITKNRLYSITYISYETFKTEGVFRGKDIKKFFYLYWYKMTYDDYCKLKGITLTELENEIRDGKIIVDERHRKPRIFVKEVITEIEQGYYSLEESHNILGLYEREINKAITDIGYKLTTKEKILKIYKKYKIEMIKNKQKTCYPLIKLYKDMGFTFYIFNKYMTMYKLKTEDFLGILSVSIEEKERFINSIKSDREKILNRGIIISTELYSELKYRKENYSEVTFDDTGYYSLGSILEFFNLDYDQFKLYYRLALHTRREIPSELIGSILNKIVCIYSKSVTQFELKKSYNLNIKVIDKYIESHYPDKEKKNYGFYDSDLISDIYEKTQGYISSFDVEEYTLISRNVVSCKMLQDRRYELYENKNVCFKKKDILTLSNRVEDVIKINQIVKLTGVGSERLKKEMILSGLDFIKNSTGKYELDLKRVCDIFDYSKHLKFGGIRENTEAIQK